MKKIFLIILPFLFCFTSKAQITFDKNDFPKPGLKIKKFDNCISCDTASVQDSLNIGIGGANDTYDFSYLNKLSANDLWWEEFVYPFLAPMGDNYQKSNIAWIEEREVASDQSLLARIDLFGMATSTAYTITGASLIVDSLAVFGNTESIATASGKYDSVNFAVTGDITYISSDFIYQSTHSDTLSLSYQVLGGKLKADEIHARTITVDGYGTLTCPIGTFQALRFKVVNYDYEKEDSLGVIYEDSDIGNSYEYWVKGVGVPLVEVQMDSAWTNIEYIQWANFIYFYGESLCDTSCVWPGDVNGDLSVNHYDLLPLGLNFSKIGLPRDYETNHWMAFNAPDWVDTLKNGENMKHADCNGDSLINFDDVTAIKQNFQMPFYKAGNTSQYNASNPDLYFDVLSGDIAPGTSVEVAIMAGKEDFSLYGLGFEVKIDPNLYEPGSLTLDWQSNWLGTANVDMLVIKKINESTGDIMAACVRNNNKSMNSHGELARITFTVRGDVTDSSSFEMAATTSGGVDSTGETKPFNGSTDTINVGISKIKNTLLGWGVYPNPSNGNLTLNLPSGTSYSYDIFNVLGKVVKHSEFNLNGLFNVNISDLQEGIYFIRIKSDKGEVRTFKINLRR